MLNNVLEAMKSDLENNLGYPVFRTDVATANDRDLFNQRELSITTNSIPCLILNFPGEAQIDRKGVNHLGYRFYGDIIVVNYDLPNLRIACEKLNTIVFDELIQHMVFSNAPQYNNTPIRRHLLNVSPRRVFASDENVFFILINVRTVLEIWI